MKPLPVRILYPFVILSLAAALFFTAGCGQRQEEGKTTVRFVTWKPNQPEVWDEIIGIFEKEHPDITIEREVGPHSSTAFHDLLTQKLKNKSTDLDVFLMDVIWPPEFGAAGWAMPLDSLIPAEEQEKFLPGPITANTYQGQLYGIPLFIDSGMLFYRKDLLAKYGFAPPRTWQEMVRQAKTITAGEKSDGQELIGFSGQFKQYEGLVCNMVEYILSNRGHIINPLSGGIEIDKKPAIEAVSFVRDEIIGNVAPSGVLTYEEPESIAPFIQGKAVFHRNWPYAWEVSNNPQRSSIAGKVGIARLPAFPSGESYSTLGGWQVGISSYSTHKDAAWEFVRFLSSERIQKLLALKAGLSPTRTALYSDREILQASPQLRDMKEVFLRAYPRPRSPLYPAISHVLQRYFSRVISERDSDIPKEAAQAAKEIRKVLALAGDN